MNLGARRCSKELRDSGDVVAIVRSKSKRLAGRKDGNKISGIYA
jgi:hypothetical protein